MTTRNEAGIYIQVAGMGASVGLSFDEGLVLTVYAQGSVILAGAVSGSVSFDPFDWAFSPQKAHGYSG